MAGGPGLEAGCGVWHETLKVFWETPSDSPILGFLGEGVPPGRVGGVNPPPPVPLRCAATIFFRISAGDKQSVFALAGLQFMSMLFMGVMFANTLQGLARAPQWYRFLHI